MSRMGEIWSIRPGLDGFGIRGSQFSEASGLAAWRTPGEPSLLHIYTSPNGSILDAKPS